MTLIIVAYTAIGFAVAVGAARYLGRTDFDLDDPLEAVGSGLIGFLVGMVWPAAAVVAGIVYLAHRPAKSNEA